MATEKAYFSSVNPKVNFPEIEEEVLRFWKKEEIFEKSVESKPKDKRWTFLDGPPFITGLPHYGSLLVSIPKDLFPRFWTMKGYRVRRVWGWDVHGLPAENKVEVKLGLKRKKDIEEKIGIKKFIAECREYVKETSAEWEWYIDHIARWVDFDNAYKTMDLPYMESVMWVFKQMYEKKYIYKGLRVSLYCPHCSTPISNFEVAMDPDNYKDITEPANTYKYQLKGEPDTFLLAWSTTPWNKIATPALAVNPKLTYVKVQQGKEKHILAKSTLKTLKDEPKYKILETFKGSTLIGKEFVPHYNFYKVDSGKKAFVVIPGDFVTGEEGTGVVTIAAYGEDDLKAMQENNIQIVLHVDDEGIVSKDSPVGSGMNYLDVNELVNKDLESRGLMYKEEQHTHTVPTCWRCHTRLYYAPQNAWYVDVQSLKSKMKATNKNVNWVPSHFKYGRYLKSLEAAPDWCISRSRYWGSPVPVWECECGERYVPESITQLEEWSGQKVQDLHRPEIDEITVKCKKCGKLARRVPEVLDSWTEAGSAAFAERHFPFEKGLNLDEFFPPDFIVEYTGQIRAWFYVLHVISTALYGSHAFKNVLVTGVILGNDGRKMSKNFGNYPDPKEMLQKYGGDALRLYLLGSPVMKGEDVLISEEEYRNQVKGFLLPLWNIYNFFVTYANVDDWKPNSKVNNSSQSVLDKWILARVAELTDDVTRQYEAYDTPAIISRLRDFIVDDLSGWYVRRSRDRVGANAQEMESKESFYNTMYSVFTTLLKLLAPVAPFVAEEMYKNLTKKESIHLSDWPMEGGLVDSPRKILEEMQVVRNIVERAHAKRKEEGIVVRQPLNSLTATTSVKLSTGAVELIEDEVNVKKVIQRSGGKVSVTLDTKITDELKAEGNAREIVRKIQNARKELGTSLDEMVVVTLPEWPKQFEDYIKSRALISEISKGEFKIERKK